VFLTPVSTKEWSPQSALQESHEKHLIWAFELRFPRDEAVGAPLCLPTLWTNTPPIGSLMMNVISPFVIGSVNGDGMISYNLVVVPSMCGGGKLP
jgi:hypothetical protein